MDEGTNDIASHICAKVFFSCLNAATALAWRPLPSGKSPTFALTDRPLALGQISLDDSWPSFACGEFQYWVENLSIRLPDRDCK